MKLSLSSWTTGTGASGEMRRTDPQMNSSSITSPITRILVREAPEISSFTRFALRLLGAMDDIPLIRNDPVGAERSACRAVGCNASPLLPFLSLFFIEIESFST
jgi:hypothetical protein